MAGQSLKMVLYALKEHYSNADNVERIIIECALTAAAAAGIGGMIPGLSVPALIIGCFGAVWVMYGRICKELGISLKKNVLKLLARAALSNIAANLGGALLVSLAGLLIPGASVAVSAVATFICVYIAGLLFVQLLGKLAAKSADPVSFSDISASEMGEIVKEAKVDMADLEAAKEAYTTNKT